MLEIEPIEDNKSDIQTRDVTAEDFEMNTLDNVSDSEKISLGQLETIEDIKQSIKDNISRNKEEFSFFEDAPQL